MVKESVSSQSSTGKEVLIKKRRHFGNFAIHHMKEMRKLVEGRVLGGDSEGWRNIAEHNLLAGVVADKIGTLVGLPFDEQAELVSVATTHDWNKRSDKEKTKKEGTATQTIGGIATTQYDVSKEIKQEQGKTGLARVTGNDWRDIKKWGVKEKILRYVDSCLISTKDGHADFVDWRIRLKYLRDRHSEVDIEAGMGMYGKPLYDKLAEITEQIEGELYGDIVAMHNELGKKYPSKEMFSDMIKDQIMQDIENTRV